MCCCHSQFPFPFFSSFGSSKFANDCRVRDEPILRVRARKKLQILNAELGSWDHCRQAGEDSTWICALFPAVMLDMVQHASFLMDSLGLLNKWRRQGRAEQFRITFGRKEAEMRSPVPGPAFPAGNSSPLTWVWMSSPVTMLPTARSAGEATL